MGEDGEEVKENIMIIYYKQNKRLILLLSGYHSSNTHIHNEYNTYNNTTNNDNDVHNENNETNNYEGGQEGNMLVNCHRQSKKYIESEATISTKSI